MKQRRANLIIPLPPFKEQRRIAEIIESYLFCIDRENEILNVNLNYAYRLRQSILKRAFEGRLVPQDPDDEPASLLLERIRAERTKAPALRGRGRSPKTKRASLIQ